MQRFDAQNTLLVMASGSRIMPEVFDSLCQAAAATVQAFDVPP